MTIIVGILYFLFVLACIFLVLIILLQEGKGGGFGEAFGGMVSETFGVKASGITKFTAILAGVFIASAILITMLRGQETPLGAKGEVNTHTESSTLETGAGEEDAGSATEDTTDDSADDGSVDDGGDAAPKEEGEGSDEGGE